MLFKQKIERKIIIDTDCGVDDAIALLMCLSAFHKLSIEAITTSTGNTRSDQASLNVNIVLEFFSDLHRESNPKVSELVDNIPVYQGCLKPLVPHDLPPNWDGHGPDGLGGVSLERKTQRKNETKHAVMALIDIVDKNKNNIELLVLGPMTNIAMATRMDPTFPSKVSNIVFMGGCLYGRGNTRLASEFNINYDPEAAYVVFEEFKKMQMVSWELTLKSALSWEYYDEWLSCQETTTYSDKMKKFIKDITKSYEKSCRKKFNSNFDFVICDAVASAVLVDPEFITEKVNRHVTVELTGKHTRGMTTIDWDDFVSKGNHQVEVIQSFSNSRWIQLLEKMIVGDYENTYPLNSN